MKYRNYLKFWFQLIIEKAKIKGPAKCSFKIYKIMSFQFLWSLQNNSGKISADRRQKNYISTELNIEKSLLKKYIPKLCELKK